MNYFRLLVIGLCCLLAGTAAHAQGKISGVVLDSVTREPLPFTSVFLANTTFGASTAEDGKFTITRIPAGTYDLVSSFIGYRMRKQSITVAGDAQQVTLLLSSLSNSLGEVVIKAQPNNPEEYQQFSQKFLGASQFSGQCAITNPDAVRVFYDEEDRVLRARAKEYVQVDNNALGYRLKYYGMEFAYDPEEDIASYYGQPVFEELKPQNEQQRQLWAANRLKAYQGSFMHFVRSVYRNRLRTENFMAQQVRIIHNKRFGQTDSMRQVLLERHPDGSDLTKAEKDSLTLWSRAAPIYARLDPTALPIDSIRRVSEDGKHVFLRFPHELQVAYFGEAPDPNYKYPMSPLGPSKTPYPPLRQVSRLKLQGQEAEIKADGSLRDLFDVSIGEYWSFEKIGEYLPLDYTPTAPPPAPAKPAARSK